MSHLKFRNVNDAFKGLVSKLHSGEIPTHVCASRVGEVAVVEEPVIVTYEKPLERVLFNAARDANPFFHLYEALWMLAGRNDIAPLAYYNSKITEIASDDGKTFNGAYGDRWRNANTGIIKRDEGGECSLHGIDAYTSDERTQYRFSNCWNRDQLNILIDHLKCKPESRRAVLQMWNVEDDLLRIDSSKDVCCNLSVCFSIEQGTCGQCNGSCYACLGNWTPERARELDENFEQGCPNCSGTLKPDFPCPKCNGKPHDQPRYLNMTVFNRSNDLLWGMLGSNYCCFSILQEYMAAHLGLKVGVYNQVTNNLHYYTERWEAEKWLADEEKPKNWYKYWAGMSSSILLIRNPEVFDKEICDFVQRHSCNLIGKEGNYIEPFFSQVVQPMCTCYHYYKLKEFDRALGECEKVKADDWRIVATEWVLRRKKSAYAKGKV